MNAIYVNIETFNLGFTFLDLNCLLFNDFDGQKLQVETNLNFFRSKSKCQNF
jgi:hypothetical protein